jgi:hypothetical protein
METKLTNDLVKSIEWQAYIKRVVKYHADLQDY